MKKNATLKDLMLELWLRERNQGKLCWTTKTGNDIPIKDMSQEHLVNTINMLNEYNEEMSHLGDYDPFWGD